MIGIVNTPDVARKNGGCPLSYRKWVKANLPREAGTQGQPRGMTLAGGTTLLKQTTVFASEPDRERIVEGFRKAPAAKKAAFRKELETAIDGLLKLREDVEE